MTILSKMMVNHTDGRILAPAQMENTVSTTHANPVQITALHANTIPENA
jgi:hypothetical protein